MPHVKHGSWDINWKLTESSGIQIYLVKYKRKSVCFEACLPYVTVDHQEQDLTLTEDTETRHGPFWFPLGSRNIQGEVQVNLLNNAIEIVADFSSSHDGRGLYHYTQIWRFHDDGRLEPILLINGPGLHSGHAYHPHWRFDFDLGAANSDVVEYHDGSKWRRMKEEGWFPIAGESNKDGAVWRQVNKASKMAVHIRPHQIEDGELFAICYDESQGAPYSPRKSAGGPAFPASFSGRNSLVKKDVALWYVSHIHYSESFPYPSGPWIKVVNN